MTNEQINKTIATYTIGYEYYDMIHCWIDYDPDKLRLYGKCKNDEYWQLVPDYCNDLNAMHEAEMTLRGTIYDYQNNSVMHKRFNDYQYHIMSRFGVSASAKERAETFLKTIGKWEE